MILDFSNAAGDILGRVAGAWSALENAAAKVMASLADAKARLDALAKHMNFPGDAFQVSWSSGKLRIRLKQQAAELRRELISIKASHSLRNGAGESVRPFYNRKNSIYELRKNASAYAALYHETIDTGGGAVRVSAGAVSAWGSVSAGLYMIGADGEQKFSPGVRAEAGASVTALDVEWDQHWFGDDNFGLDTSVDLTIGEASASGIVTAQLFNADGKPDVQIYAEAKAEAILAEARGSVGLSILGGGVTVSGGVRAGVGAHFTAGLKDGVVQCDIGASLGIGFSLSFEVDLGSMVKTLAGSAFSALGFLFH